MSPRIPDAERGVYRKFDIKRTDGSHRKGRKHADCAYFVLDLEHDRFAIPALIAYAEACRKEFPELAEDLRRIVATTPCNCRSVGECPHRLEPQTPNEAMGVALSVADDEDADGGVVR